MADDTTISLPGGPEPEFNALWQDFASLHYQWRALREMYAEEERIELMNAWAPSFFGMVQRLLQDSIFLGIERLLQGAQSGGQPNLSLEHLADRIKDPELAGELRIRRAELRRVADPLTQHRHKRIGHRDRAVALKTQALPPIQHKLVKDLFGKLEAFMNRIETTFSPATPLPLDQIVDNAGGHNALFGALRRAQEHLEAEEQRNGVPPRPDHQTKSRAATAPRRSREHLHWLRELKPLVARWIPNSVHAFLGDAGARVDGCEPWKLGALDDTLRLLLASPRLGLWWQGRAGREVARDPAQLWRLADCIRIVRSDGQIASSLGGDPYLESVRWLLRPRAARDRLARKLAGRASELSQALRDTPFNMPVYLLRSLARARPADAEVRIEGVLIADALSWLAVAVERDASRSQARELPAFSNSRRSRTRRLILFVQAFHETSLGLVGEEAREATLQVVSAALGYEVGKLAAQNALRSMPSGRRPGHPFKKSRTVAEK